MPSVVSIDTKDVDVLFDRINRLQYEGLQKPLTEATKKLKFKLKQNVLEGKTPRGESYPTVVNATMEMEIKREGSYEDKRIRKSVSTNRIAMNVTNKSLNSINTAKVSYREFNVGYDGERADIVFQSNARDIGNSSKPKRDPLGLSLNVATEEEFEIVADEVERAIDEVINGL